MTILNFMAVNRSYFTDNKKYINRNRWLELRQQATEDPTITQVDVRKVHDYKKSFRD
ncbi:protein rep [Bacillus atrophaeus]|uniref:protein rep n=1 Tax=Bacillus atrophaeus TaxID=1452 RepID=UPI00142D6638